MVMKFLKLYMKETCKRQNSQYLESRKYIMKKGNIVYVKWKRYDDAFNSCINANDTKVNFAKLYGSYKIKVQF